MMIEKEAEMLSWNEMSPLEQAQCQFWDMYKDAYGVRPRGIDTTSWTLEQFDAEFETLATVIQREEEQWQGFTKQKVAKATMNTCVSCWACLTATSVSNPTE